MGFRHRGVFKPKRKKDGRDEISRAQGRVHVLRSRYKAHLRWSGLESGALSSWVAAKGWRRFLWGLWHRVALRRKVVLARQIRGLDRGLGKFGAAWSAHLLDELEAVCGRRGVVARLFARAARVRLDRIRGVEADLAWFRHAYGRVGGGRGRNFRGRK